MLERNVTKTAESQQPLMPGVIREGSTYRPAVFDVGIQADEERSSWIPSTSVTRLRVIKKGANKYWQWLEERLRKYESLQNRSDLERLALEAEINEVWKALLDFRRLTEKTEKLKSLGQQYQDVLQVLED